MDIKQFLKQKEVQEYLANNDLTSVYKMLPNADSVSDLTKFFIENKIELLKYVSTVVPYMYFGLNIRRIKLPKHITSIDKSAFSDCIYLKRIVLPNNLSGIGDSAFYQCETLCSIELPNNIKSIGRCAFWGCYDLTNLTIPDSVTHIGDGAFDFCSELIINCTKDSYAHKYAVENEIKFELI